MKTKVVTETATVTVTEIVYLPESSSVPPPAPKTTDVVVPTPKPQPEEPTPYPEPAPEPTPTPEPVPSPKPTQPPQEEKTYQPYPAPEPTPIPEPTTTTMQLKPSPAPKPPVNNNPGDLTDFERSFVDKHNELRAKTGAPPLTLDRTMASYANQHVSSCIFEHSSPHKYGENLGAGYPSIEATIQAWFDEWTEYPFDKPDFYPGSGHFTQVVWKAATKVGCGMKQCNGANGTPGVYYSCNYDAGNLIGSFAENVSRPQ